MKNDPNFFGPMGKTACLGREKPRIQLVDLPLQPIIFLAGQGDEVFGVLDEVDLFLDDRVADVEVAAEIFVLIRTGGEEGEQLADLEEVFVCTEIRCSHPNQM